MTDPRAIGYSNTVAVTGLPNVALTVAMEHGPSPTGSAVDRYDDLIQISTVQPNNTLFTVFEPGKRKRPGAVGRLVLICPQ